METAASASASLKRLLNVLAERDIELGHDDLAWLFDSPQTRNDMIAWVTEYLNPDTLLSREELEIYSSIPPTNSNKNATPGQDQALGRPLEEFDFENAIVSLENSTAAIERQCATMAAQREALQALQKQNRKSSSIERVQSQQQQSRARVKTQKDLETVELAEAVKHRVVTVGRQIETSITLLTSSVKRQVDKDDRLLDGLQKVMSNLEPVESNAGQMLEVEQLSRALITLHSKIVKHRTNKVYATALRAACKANDETGMGVLQSEDAVDNEHTIALTEELDSLVAEVDSVLEMAIDHQHRRPILEALKRSDLEARQQQKEWLDYVHNALRSMTDRLEELATHTENTAAYGTAIAAVQQALTAIVPPPAVSAKASSTQQSQKTAKPLVLRSDLGGPKDPALELLLYYGIHTPTSSLDSPADVATALEREVNERIARQQGLAEATEQSISAQVAESVTTADAQLESLLKAVYAYSPFATVNLSNAETARRIEMLEKDIAAAGEKMGRLDVEALIQVERTRLNEVLEEGVAGL